MVRLAVWFALLGANLLAPGLVGAGPVGAPFLPLRVVGAKDPQAVAVAKATLAPLGAASSDSLVQIGQFYRGAGIALGDTDHDFRTEVVVSVNDNLEFTYRILENQGDDVYVETYRSTQDLYPSAIADLNLNGREEIIGQYSYYLQVYESPDRYSHPSQLLWSSPPLSNFIGMPTVGDTDRDGRPEIIHSVNLYGNQLVIYEWNPVQNTFALVYDAIVDSSQQAGRKVIADFDGDGLIEIALGGTNGRLHVLESTADDTWMEIFTANTGLSNAYGVAGGEDVNRNGRPEIFIVGDSSTGNNWHTLTYVYEATGDNEFARVDSMAVPGDLGGADNGIANLDGCGGASYILTNYSGPKSHLRVYDIPSPGSWILAQDFVPPTIHNEFAIYDANHNGRDEIFWVGPGSLQSNGHSIILEVSHSPSSTGELLRLEPIQVAPTPCRLETTIRLPTSTSRAAYLSAYDVAGKLVDRRIVPPSPGTQILWPARLFSPGIYFLRLEDRTGHTLAAGRVVTVR